MASPLRPLNGHLLVAEGCPSVVIAFIGWILAFGATAIPAYMIWTYAKRASELNRRIAACDPTLLTDDGLNVSRLMAVPEGAQYIENAEIIAAPMAPVYPQTGMPYSER